MLFTPAERRLLAAIALLLAIGYLVSALRYWGLLPPAAVEREVVLTPGGGSEAPANAPDETGARPEPIDPDWFHEGFLDLNRADSVALVALPGIGPALSGRILTARRRRGGFADLEQLLSVPGIGPKRLARLRDYLCVRADPDSLPPGPGPRPAPWSAENPRLSTGR